MFILCIHNSLGLHWERLVEELLIEMFLDIVHQDYCHSSVIVLWSPRPPHHLEDVSDWVVHIAL